MNNLREKFNQMKETIKANRLKLGVGATIVILLVAASTLLAFDYLGYFDEGSLVAEPLEAEIVEEETTEPDVEEDEQILAEAETEEEAEEIEPEEEESSEESEEESVAAEEEEDASVETSVNNTTDASDTTTETTTDTSTKKSTSSSSSTTTKSSKSTTNTTTTPTKSKVTDSDVVSQIEEDADDGITYYEIDTDDFWYSCSSHYFYNNMSTAEQNFYDAVYAVSYNYLTTTANIDLQYSGSYYICINFKTYGLTQSQAVTILQIFTNNNPQFYFIDGSKYVYTDTVIGVNVYSAFINGKTRESYTASLESTVQSVVSAAQSAGGSDSAAVLHYIYVWVCESVSYCYGEISESTAPYNQSCASVFFGNGSTVCAGYTEAFVLLANAAGITTVAVSYTASDSSSYGHEWALSLINGKFYVIDVTNGDVNSTYTYQYDSSYDELVLYTNNPVDIWFLRTISYYTRLTGYTADSCWYTYGLK